MLSFNIAIDRIGHSRTTVPQNGSGLKALPSHAGPFVSNTVLRPCLSLKLNKPYFA